MSVCTRCGTAASQVDQRFCHACGQALPTAEPAAVEPAAAAPIEQPTSTAVLPAPIGNWQTTSPVDPNLEAAAFGAPPASPGSRRRLGLVATVVAVVLALAGGAWLGFSLLSNKGGGSSPEDAVTKLVNAVADQDGVEALRMLAPGETEGIDDIYASLQKRLSKSGLVNGDDHLLDAVKIELTGLELETDKNGDNGARVYLTGGKAKISFDPDKLPEGYAAIADDIDQDSTTVDAQDLIDELDDNSGVRPFVTTIKVDGRWYVSPVATVGEYVVDDQDLKTPNFDLVDPDNAPEPVVGKDPEEALTNFIDALSSTDPDKVLATLPQDEFAAVRPFSKVIADQIDQYEVSLEVNRTGDLDTSFQDLGNDLGKLTVNKLSVDLQASGDGESDSGSLSISGDCITADDDDEECIPSEVKDNTGIDSYWVIVRKGDGGWQVDPLATVIDYAKTALDKVSDSVALYAMELPGFIKSSAELTAGESKTLDTDGLGHVMTTVHADEGQVIVPFGDAEIYTPGSVDYSDNSDGKSYVAGESGTYHLLWTADANSSTEVKVDVLDIDDASGDGALTTFSGHDAGAYTVYLSGSYDSDRDDVQILDSDGYAEYSEDGSYSSLDGTYTVVVFGDTNLTSSSDYYDY